MKRNPLFRGMMVIWRKAHRTPGCVSLSTTLGLESVSSVPECEKKVQGLWSGSLELLGSRRMGMQSQQVNECVRSV